MTDLAWLIEAPGPHYLTVRELPRTYFEGVWTKDHNAALRFCDREQAEAVMGLLRMYDPAMFAFARTLGEPRAVEHSWVSP